MKVYVAGASAEIERCEALITKLREHGIAVTSEWPESVRKAGSANHGLDHETRLDAARDCASSVAVSDWIVALEPESGTHTIGAWVELGIALARGVKVLWVGDGDCSIFESMSTSSVSGDDEAFFYLLGIAKAGA